MRLFFQNMGVGRLPEKERNFSKKKPWRQDGLERAGPARHKPVRAGRGQCKPGAGLGQHQPS